MSGVGRMEGSHGSKATPFALASLHRLSAVLTLLLVLGFSLFSLSGGQRQVTDDVLSLIIKGELPADRSARNLEAVE